MRVLRAVILAIGMMGLAAACGGGNKGAQEPAPPAEGNPCAAPAEGGDEAAPAVGGDEKPAEGGDEAANPCGGGEDM
jgi:hypothetical protein